MSAPRPPRGDATRLAHAGLALAVTLQLATSLVMRAPSAGAPENVWFEIHEISGLTALVFAGAFWIVVATRRGGAPMAALFPWASRPRLRALRENAAAEARALRRLRRPDGVQAGPLASAVHGLGLALIAAMALAGGAWWTSEILGAGEAAWGEAALALHKAMATLVWIYLVGHGGVALLRHWTGGPRLGTMWRPGGARP